MSDLPHHAKPEDLLRWVVANPNEPFDPPMIVALSTGHTSDWEFQAVLAQMEELRHQGYITKLKQDPWGSTFWTITPSGTNYLRALENSESNATQGRTRAQNKGEVSGQQDVPQNCSVFLCHSSADKASVRDLYRRLKDAGFLPWLDEENLIAGQEWEYEIKRAVRKSDVVVVCLSRNSISKTGFIQKELKFALDVADERPEGSIFIIPLKLEPCDIPERLAKWHWINSFDDGGYERLIRALRAWVEEAAKGRASASLHPAPEQSSSAHSRGQSGAPGIGPSSPPGEAGGRLRGWERIALLIFGISFLTAMLVLAIALPNPTYFQLTVFRVALSLSAAAVVVFIPGFIDFRISSRLRAGGALAVFAIVYFINPEQIVIPPRPSSFVFSGRVWDETSKKTISDAHVSVAEDQNVPQTARTDVDGIFHIQLSPATQSLKITVDANGYESVIKDANPRRTGPEEIYIRHLASSAGRPDLRTFRFDGFSPSVKSFDASVSFLNKGDGAALDIRVLSATAVMPDSRTPEVQGRALYRKLDRIGVATLRLDSVLPGQGQSFTLPGPRLTAAQEANVSNGTSRVFFVGRITYRSEPQPYYALYCGYFPGGNLSGFNKCANELEKPDTSSR